MGFPEHLAPSAIKNQIMQPFLPPLERSQSRPTQGGKKQTMRQPEGDPIRAQGDPP